MVDIKIKLLAPSRSDNKKTIKTFAKQQIKVGFLIAENRG
jgi:hypothetical protein